MEDFPLGFVVLNIVCFKLFLVYLFLITLTKYEVETDDNIRLKKRENDEK